MTNNQNEKLFSNKFIQKFLENEPAEFLKSKHKFDEIASSLSYYLKSFSNINKLLDYVCLIFKHIFSENIILIIPLNYEGEIWNENIKISVNYEYLTIQEEINSFLNQFHFSKNFKIKEILTFENALKNNFKEYSIETKKITSRGGVSLAVSEEVNLPIRFIGAGEGIKDLRPFNSYEFVEAMLADK